MSGSRNIPIRLTGDVIKRIDRIAERFGMTRSGVVKFCTQSFLEEFESSGKSALPINWREILHNLDGRVSRHRQSQTATGTNGSVTQIQGTANFSSGASSQKPGAKHILRRKKK
jgi:hypothetical protein